MRVVKGSSKRGAEGIRKPTLEFLRVGVLGRVVRGGEDNAGVETVERAVAGAADVSNRVMGEINLGAKRGPKGRT